MTKDLRSDVAHSARVYDYWLGGKDNFAPDRALGEIIKDAVEAVPMTVKANRKFMLRAARYLVGQAGIRQFLDIGTGIPTSRTCTRPHKPSPPPHGSFTSMTTPLCSRMRGRC